MNNYKSMEYCNENGIVDCEGIILDKQMEQREVELLEPVAIDGGTLNMKLNYVPAFFHTAPMEFKIIHLN